MVDTNDTHPSVALVSFVLMLLAGCWGFLVSAMPTAGCPDDKSSLVGLAAWYCSGADSVWLLIVPMALVPLVVVAWAGRRAAAAGHFGPLLIGTLAAFALPVVVMYFLRAW